MSGPRPVAGIVQRLLRGLGIASDVDRVAATREWHHAASAVLGPDAVNTRALRVDDTTLVVAVPSSAWSGEIRLREHELLEALSERSPQSGITAIRCVPSSGGRKRADPQGGGATAP